MPGEWQEISYLLETATAPFKVHLESWGRSDHQLILRISTRLQRIPSLA